MQLSLYTVSSMKDQVLIKHLGWIENNVLWVTSTFHATQSERSQCHEGSTLLRPSPVSSSLPSSHCSAQWCSPSNRTCWIVCCFVQHWIRWVELDTFSWHRCRQARGFQSLMSPRSRPEQHSYPASSHIFISIPESQQGLIVVHGYVKRFCPSNKGPRWKFPR